MASKELEQIRAALFEFRDLIPAGESPDPATMRAGMEAAVAHLPVVEGTEVEPVNLDGFAAEWVRAPGAGGDEAILYLHGGGYVVGSPLTHRSLTAELSAVTGAAVLAPDYRLAPEHPYPAAVEDGLAAYRYLLDCGIAPGRIAVSGDSAGGGLALAALVAARDAGLPMPACLAPISPWADLTASSSSYRERAAQDPMIDPEKISDMVTLYLGGNAVATDPMVSPAFADLSGLPPMLIHVGEDEVLLGDSELVRDAAARAGVACEMVVFPELFHVFHIYQAVLPEAKAAVAALGRFFRSHWATA